MFILTGRERERFLFYPKRGKERDFSPILREKEKGRRGFVHLSVSYISQNIIEMVSIIHTTIDGGRGYIYVKVEFVEP